MRKLLIFGFFSTQNTRNNEIYERRTACRQEYLSGQQFWFRVFVVSYEKKPHFHLIDKKTKQHQ